MKEQIKYSGNKIEGGVPYIQLFEIEFACVRVVARFTRGYIPCEP